MLLSRRTVAELSLVGIAAVWGLTFVMVKDAIQTLPVFAFLAYRFLPAAALVALSFKKSVGTLSPRALKAGVVMGIFLTGGYVFQTLGLERTSAANAGFITGMWVVLTPLFGRLFFKERIGLHVYVAAAVSTLGLLLLTGAGRGDLDLVGDGLVLLCAISFTFHIFATDRAVADHDVGGLLVVQLAVCGVITLIVAGSLGQLQVPRIPAVWIALAVTSVIASALGFFVQTFAQQHASPARTALILASEPAFAGAFAYLVAGERLGAVAWLGAGLILVAIVAVEALPYVTRLRRVPEIEHPLPEQ